MEEKGREGIGWIMIDRGIKRGEMREGERRNETVKREREEKQMGKKREKWEEMARERKKRKG